MKKLFLYLAVVAVLGLPAIARANSFSFQPSPIDLNDLDHHLAYSWKINNVFIPAGHVITSAKITIKGIANWDSNPNMLFIHLLDTAVGTPGVHSFTDATGSPVASSQIIDDFDPANVAKYAANPLITAGTGNTFLKAQQFTTTPTDFTYNLTQAQLDKLLLYIQNDNTFAFGIDPDCHFFNDGIKFYFETGKPPVPEPATLTLLGLGLAGWYVRRRRQA